MATLSRGPWCPPSTFFVLHRRSLGRLLRSFQLWQKAWDAKALTRDAKRLRWSMSRALLAPGEATLLLYYNFQFSPEVVQISIDDLRARIALLFLSVLRFGAASCVYSGAALNRLSTVHTIQSSMVQSLSSTNQG